MAPPSDHHLPASASSAGDGALVAFCGLHGGAGTTRLATLLAAAAAQRNPGGHVLLAETDPAGGGLAHATNTTSPHGLSHLARTPAPPGHPGVAGPDGVRLIAAAPAPRNAAALGDVAALLERLRSQHLLTVIDAGTLREPHGQPALQTASHVMWVTAAGGDPDHARTLLASPLAHAAARARQAILINRARPDAPSRAGRHRPLAAGAGKLILTPQLTDEDTEAHVARYLLAAIT